MCQQLAKCFLFPLESPLRVSLVAIKSQTASTGVAIALPYVAGTAVH